MRLYSLTKPQFAFVFVSFVTFYVLALLIGLAGPPITSTRHRNASELANFKQIDLSKGPFLLHSPVVSAYCQQLWLFAKILTDTAKNEGEKYEDQFEVNADVSGLNNEGSRNAPSKLFSSSHYSILSCMGPLCQEVIVTHVWHLKYQEYVVNVTFDGLEQFHMKHLLKDITFYWRSYNPSFIQLEIGFRFAFLIITFGVTIWFFQTMRSHSFYHWTMEQIWMSILLPLLMLYNNPFYPLIFLMEGWLASAADSLFQASFLCGLLLFWLCVYHGVRQRTRKWLTFYIPKLILVGLLWLCCSILSIWDRYYQATGHSLLSAQLPLKISHFQSFKIILYILGGFYILYLCFLIIRAYSELKNLPYFDIRLKTHTILMLMVIGVTVAITVLHFGVSPSLQDSFVSHLDANFSSSIQFMAFYGLLNLYLYTMAFVYSPSPDVKTEYKLGVMSAELVNDSEDELLFGSDFKHYSPKKLSIDSDED